MTPDAYDLLAREYFTGAWAVSSLVLLLVVGRALVREAWATPRWWADFVIQGIAALWVLVAGSFARAFSRWIDLIYLNAGLDSGIWGSWVLLFPVAVLFFTGQALCVYAYTPTQWRWPVFWTGLALTLIVPAVPTVAMLWR